MWLAQSDEAVFALACRVAVGGFLAGPEVLECLEHCCLACGCGPPASLASSALGPLLAQQWRPQPQACPISPIQRFLCSSLLASVKLALAGTCYSETALLRCVD